VQHDQRAQERRDVRQVVGRDVDEHRRIDGG
jgi:hypothetical protein